MPKSLKILFVGSIHGTSGSLHYFTNLVKLGHKVLPYDPQFYASSGIADTISLRLRKGPGPKKRRLFAEALLRLCKNNAFDAVFVMAENYVSADAMENVRKEMKNPPQFLFHSHDNVFAKGIKTPADFSQALAAYDAAFTTKSQNVQEYKALGQARAFFIPSAYEPCVHFPDGGFSQTRPFPISFVGTFDTSRVPYIDAIGWKNLYVWGNHWYKYKGYRENKQRITPRSIYYFEFARVVSKTLCSLGLLREEAEDLHTQRTFEIPACGSLQFAPRNAEILSFFEEDKEIVCFSSVEELNEKLDYFLQHPEKALKLAQAGHLRVVESKHTYQDRVRAMLALVFDARQSVYQPPVWKNPTTVAPSAP